MKLAGPILILTAEDDLHADYVVARLHERGEPVVRLDPGDAASPRGQYEFSLDANRVRVRLSTASGAIELPAEPAKSVLVRRPSRPHSPDALAAEPTERFFLGEAAAVLDAVAYLIGRDALWVNHPEAGRRAAMKLYQLRVAHASGLAIPDTLVTNNPDQAFAFYCAHAESVICKPLSSTPVREDGTEFLYTHLLPPAQVRGDFDDVVFGSSVLQAAVRKRSDVRVAVIGEEVFGCEILSQQDPRATTDWRVVPTGLEHVAIPVPEAVVDGLQDLRRRLGLSAMHCDFAIDSVTCQWWFLEANPNGQWLWIELAIGAPIADAIAKLLAHQ